MRSLKDIVGEKEYEKLKIKGINSTFFGYPLKSFKKEDLIVVIGRLGEELKGRDEIIHKYKTSLFR